jgi:hypothetical protein
MSMIDNMMGFMMGRMSTEEKDAMMNRMMDKFFADMTLEDKQKLMAEMMSKMMEGMNMMEMMPQMMRSMMGGGEGRGGMMGKMSHMEEGGKEKARQIMPQMMMDMMPRCLAMMLPTMPKEKRVDFVFRAVTTLMDEGCAGMSEEEKEDLAKKVVEKVGLTSSMHH